MTDISTTDFRTLLRLIEPLRTLAVDVQQSLHMDTFRGTSNLLIKNYDSLQGMIAEIINDRYATSLTLELHEDLTEREIVSQIALAAAQLLAYVESFTGVPSAGKSGDTQIQTAPHIVINAQGTSQRNLKRMMELAKQDAEEDDEDDD